MAVTSTGLAVNSGHDGFYRVWDIKSNALLWEIRVGNALGSSGFATFTPDEKSLAYIDLDGVVRITPLDNDAVIAQTSAALTRSLTDDECTQYLLTDGSEEVVLAD